MADFTDIERQRIRAKLIAYKKAHRIGTRTLATRITESSPRGTEVPLKTLQNFLADARRTNDVLVALCARFAAALPLPDPAGELGLSMAEFYSAGPYDRCLGQHAMVISYPGPRRGNAQGLFVVTGDDKFCRVADHVIEGDRVLTFDGVLAGHDALAIVMMKERLRGYVKHYILEADESLFSGIGTVAEFDLQPHRTAESILSSFRVRIGNHAADLAGSFGPRRSDAQPFSQPDHPIRADRVARDPTSDRAGQAENERRMRMTNDQHESPDAIQAAFLTAAERGDKAQLKSLLDRGADINRPDLRTGLTALHLAVGRDRLAAARLLIDRGAQFLPDRQGRLPTTVASECEVSEEMCALIVTAEARFQPV